jgi:hypothetical protein
MYHQREKIHLFLFCGQYIQSICETKTQWWDVGNMPMFWLVLQKEM